MKARWTAVLAAFTALAFQVAGGEAGPVRQPESDPPGPRPRLAVDEPPVALPILVVADTSSFEGDSGSRPLVFVARLSSPAAVPVLIRLRTFDGTATASGNDYLPASADLEIPAGQTESRFEVTVFGDSLLEGNESFGVEIVWVENAVPERLQGIGTLLNDERTRFESLLTDIPDYRPGTLAPDWGDANGDGLPDLPMYLNDGGSFEEMPGFRTLLGDGNYHGGAWCDYDRDGDMDLVLMPYGDSTRTYDRVRLLRNDQSGFVDVAHELGMDIPGHGETAVWADFDADGWPDLFLPFYAHVPPYQSYLYLNRRDGTFVDFTDEAGVGLPGLSIYLRPEGACAADWDGDGAIDLYCASHLFHNDGGARFRDIAATAGLPVQFDEGAQFVDYDNDGDLDLCLRTASGPTLYRKDGDSLIDSSASLGIGPLGWLWGDRWTDIDLDGDPDLFFFDPERGLRLLLSNGDGTFTEDTTIASLDLPGTLCAFADFEGDGDPDIAVGDYGKRFVRNLLDLVPRSRTHFVKVRLEDTDGRLVLHGSTVRLRSLDDPRHPVQTRIVDGGSGYLGQDEYVVTFGGVGSGAFDLEVSFPGSPGQPVLTGPAQNPLLGDIRPGDLPPSIYVIRPDHSVSIEQLPTPSARAARRGALRAAPPSTRPSPARSSTALTFTFPSRGDATISVYDVGGRHVRTMTQVRPEAGPGEVTWDLRDQTGTRVRVGLYFVRLTFEGRVLGSWRVVVLS